AAHLIDGRDGFEVWNKSFERRIDDIFGVQIEIAYLVVDALVARLASGAQPELKRVGGTANADAYDAFLRGNALYANAVDEATDREALAMFDKAIELDQAYALAHAARARSLMIIAGNYSTGEEIGSHYNDAQAAAERSVEIAPNLADAQSVLGFVLFYARLDAQAALEPYRKSYELGFGNADTLSRFARFAAQVGNFQDAHTAINRAKELDPLNQGLLRSEAVIDYDARNFVRAARALRAALRDNPKSPGPNYMLGNIAFLEGDLDAARNYYEAEPQQMARTGGLAMIAFKSGETGTGESLLGSLADEFGDNSLYVRAQVRAQAGQLGEALSMLEQALAIGDSGLVQLRNDPLLDGLRSDPAFTAMLAKIGFEV
ncbi:MAG TPA: tetratricopeptide repeat protein, partial [Sphingomonadaceae bacterium]|nr:tetratricopeptide repeat protein [Sphingomonadaceae bacterium]